MKPSNRIPLVAAVVVVVAVVVATFMFRGRDDTGAGQSEAAPQEAAPQSSVQAGPVPPRRKAAGGQDRSGLQEGVLERVEQRAEMRRQHDERTRALREQSAQRFASEQVDPAWAPQKTSALSAIADDPGFEVAGAQPKSLNVDCRSSMCRIEGQFASSGVAEDWILMYMSSVGSEMPNSVVSRSRNPDGSTRVEIYGRAR